MPTVDSRRVAREEDDERFGPPSYPQHQSYPVPGGTERYANGGSPDHEPEVIQPHPRPAGPPARRRRNLQEEHDPFDPATDVLDVSRHALNAVDVLSASFAEDEVDANLSLHVRGLRKLHRVEHNEQVSRVEQEVKNLCDLGLLHQDEELALHVADDEGRADEVLSRIEACRDPALIEFVATNGGTHETLSSQQLLPLRQEAHREHLDVVEHSSHPHQREDLEEFDRTATSMLRAGGRRSAEASFERDQERQSSPREQAQHSNRSAASIGRAQPHEAPQARHNRRSQVSCVMENEKTGSVCPVQALGWGDGDWTKNVRRRAKFDGVGAHLQDPLLKPPLFFCHHSL